MTKLEKRILALLPHKSKDQPLKIYFSLPYPSYKSTYVRNELIEIRLTESSRWATAKIILKEPFDFSEKTILSKEEFEMYDSLSTIHSTRAHINKGS